MVIWLVNKTGGICIVNNCQLIISSTMLQNHTILKKFSKILVEQNSISKLIINTKDQKNICLYTNCEGEDQLCLCARDTLIKC
jgi:hypothetical protein